jgi:hypothetical protein
VDFISYISSVIMRDMRDKVYIVLGIVGVIGAVVILPYLIKGFFWILLQMMLFPMTSLIILVNLMVWNWVYILYTEKTVKK